MAKDEEIVSDDIQWSLFESPWMKITEQPTDLTITGWAMVQREINGKPAIGIKSRVIAENGKETDKELVTTSKRLINQLKPLILSAEKDGRKTVSFRISKSGTGMNTIFFVRGL